MVRKPERLANRTPAAAASWAVLSATGELGAAAGLLLQEYRVEAGWKAASDAVGWFVQRGWEVDQQGESLFRDDPELPGGLAGVLSFRLYGAADPSFLMLGAATVGILSSLFAVGTLRLAQSESPTSL